MTFTSSVLCCLSYVSVRVKCKVYKAIVLATLLYGAETWTVHKAQVQKLHA